MWILRDDGSKYQGVRITVVGPECHSLQRRLGNPGKYYQSRLCHGVMGRDWSSGELRVIRDCGEDMISYLKGLTPDACPSRVVGQISHPLGPPCVFDRGYQVIPFRRGEAPQLLTWNIEPPNGLLPSLNLAEAHVYQLLNMKDPPCSHDQQTCIDGQLLLFP